MPRIRTIKPECFQDEKLSPLDVTTRFVFLGLISMADDAGRLLDNVRVIDAFIFPETADSSRDALATLSRIGRLRRGVTASGQKVIQIVNWTRHQKVDKPNFAAALPELVGTEQDSAPREAVANESRDGREDGATHTNDLRPTTDDLRPTTDEQQQHGATLPEAVRVAAEPFIRSARRPAAVAASIAAELSGMHGQVVPEPIVVRALDDMAAAGVSPFSPKAFRAFCRGARDEAVQARERKADASAAASRAEGEGFKRAAPPRVYTDGLPPDQVPSVADLMRSVGIVPPHEATPSVAATADERARAFRLAAEQAKRHQSSTAPSDESSRRSA